MSRQHRPHPRDIVVVVGGNGNPKGVVRVHTIARHARRHKRDASVNRTVRRAGGAASSSAVGLGRTPTVPRPRSRARRGRRSSNARGTVVTCRGPSEFEGEAELTEYPTARPSAAAARARDTVSSSPSPPPTPLPPPAARPVPSAVPPAAKLPASTSSSSGIEGWRGPAGGSRTPRRPSSLG